MARVLEEAMAGGARETGSATARSAMASNLEARS